MLTGKKILVVEDEPLVAMLVEDMLDELGCAIVGPAMRLTEALDLAETQEIDAALLDVNVNGGRSFAVAEMLRSRGIPYLFATGYGSGEELKDRTEPVLQKPYQIERLEAAMAQLFG